MSENPFATMAADYARFRPSYPPELFTHLAALAPGHELAWDCATGNGQAAQALAGHFKTVIATDISAEMLAQAAAHPRITYRQADALASGLPDSAADLVTVATAMHWFHGPAFEAEVRRVLRPGGLIAAWCLSVPRITPAVDRVVRHVHDVLVDPFWIAPNRLVEGGYKDLPFGFKPLDAPALMCTGQADMAALEGYMRTWSASLKYLRAHGKDPVDLVHADLLAAWGDPAQVRPVRWNVHLRLGRP